MWRVEETAFEAGSLGDGMSGVPGMSTEEAGGYELPGVFAAHAQVSAGDRWGIKAPLSFQAGKGRVGEMAGFRVVNRGRDGVGQRLPRDRRNNKFDVRKSPSGDFQTLPCGCVVRGEIKQQRQIKGDARGLCHTPFP